MRKRERRKGRGRERKGREGKGKEENRPVANTFTGVQGVPQDNFPKAF
jgi:hypothetical protein